MKPWLAGHLNRCLRQVERSGQLAASGPGHVALLHVLLLQAGQLLARERGSVTATLVEQRAARARLRPLLAGGTVRDGRGRQPRRLSALRH